MYWGEKTKPFKADLDIYKANGDYDYNKIAKIDMEVIDFAYENSIMLMKEMDDDTKAISTRSTSMFGYLTAIALALGAFVFNLSISENYIGYKKEMVDIAIILSSTYAIIPFFMVGTVFSPQSKYHAHNEPQNLLTQKTFQHGIKLAKIIEIETLQEKIKHKKKLLKKSIDWMEIYKACLCLSLPVAFVIAWVI